MQKGYFTPDLHMCFSSCLLRHWSIYILGSPDRNACLWVQEGTDVVGSKWKNMYLKNSQTLVRNYNAVTQKNKTKTHVMITNPVVSQEIWYLFIYYNLIKHIEVQKFDSKHKMYNCNIISPEVLKMEL